MQPPNVAYMGATIIPLIARSSSGFSCTVVIADANHERWGSGELGMFETKVKAYRSAIAYGKFEIDWRGVVTLAG